MRRILFLLMTMLSASFAVAEDVIQVVPFKTIPGIEYNEEDEDAVGFSLWMNNEIAYTAFQFEMYIPVGMSLAPYVNEEGKTEYYCNMNKDRFPTNRVRVDRFYVDVPIHKLEITDMGDGHYHVTCYESDFAKIKGNSGELITFYFNTSTDMKPGVYPIRVEGTILGEKDESGIHGIEPATSVSYVTITDTEGNAPANALIDLGDNLVPSFVEETLPDHNVIKNGVCENLVLTDKADFSAPTNFTATSATYTREMANKWGTIVLPYEVTSNDDVAYYLPETVENDVLKLTFQEALPANTPALVAKLNGEGITSHGEGVKVVIEDKTYHGGNVPMYGSYVNDTKVTDANAYYIKENQFWLNNGYFYIDAFRAYFTVSTSGPAKSLRISEGTVTALSALTGEGDVKVEAFYDESGKQQDGLRKGLNIMKMSNGTSQKVLIQ